MTAKLKYFRLCIIIWEFSQIMSLELRKMWIQKCLLLCLFLQKTEVTVQGMCPPPRREGKEDLRQRKREEEREIEEREVGKKGERGRKKERERRGRGRGEGEKEWLKHHNGKYTATCVFTQIFIIRYPNSLTLREKKNVSVCKAHTDNEERMHGDNLPRAVLPFPSLPPRCLPHGFSDHTTPVSGDSPCLSIRSKAFRGALFTLKTSS